LLSGCTLLLDAGETQCQTDVDCTSRGGAFAGSICADSVCVRPASDAGHDAKTEAGKTPHRDAHVARDSPPDSRGDTKPGEAGAFACLGHHPFPTASKSSVSFAMTLTDYFTSAPVTSVSVAVCVNPTDPSCALPFATAIPDATGTVTFMLDTSNGPFTGYFKVDPLAPGMADGGGADGAVRDGGGDATTATPAGYVPARIYYSDDPIADDFTDSWGLFTVSIESALTALFGLTPIDQRLGIALLTVYGCGPLKNGVQAAGVSVAIDTSSTKTEGFYIQNGMPSGTATETDSSGVAGFIDVTPGVRTFTATQVSTGTVVSTLSAYVFPGVVTYANVEPTYMGR
jgi:hypothetical protein